MSGVQALKFIFVLVAILLATLSIFALIVDGVAIIISYVSIPFAVLALGLRQRYLLKVYMSFFIMAHVVLLWRILSDMQALP